MKAGTGTVGLLKDTHAEEYLMRAPRLGRRKSSHRASHLDSSEGSDSSIHPNPGHHPVGTDDPGCEWRGYLRPHSQCTADTM